MLLRVAVLTISLSLSGGFLKSKAGTLHFVPLSTNVIDGDLSPFNNISSGDTLLFEPGERPFILIKNIYGTIDNPVLLINGNGLVEIKSGHYYGLSIRQSRHLKVCGSGYNEEKYGIQISNISGNGISIGDFSSDIEICNIKISNCSFSGIMAKTEPTCGFIRASFIQENTVIHDCCIQNTGFEGMYIGSSFYRGQSIECEGNTVNVYPPLLRKVKIYNNLVENTGWDAIQVSSAEECSIHDNIVLHDSRMKAEWQMNGIILGDGSSGDIYNNLIEQGEGSGIFTNASGRVRIYNNTIIEPGYSNNLPSGYYGIYADDKNQVTESSLHIFNNLIIYPSREGIRYICSGNSGRGNILNNAIILRPKNVNNIEGSFIRIVGDRVNVNANYMSTGLTNTGFTNAENNDFRPGKYSPLIDAGCPIPFNDILKDASDKSRIIGNAIDIGPFESEYSRTYNKGKASDNKCILLPNPAGPDSDFILIFNINHEGWVEIKAWNMEGISRKLLKREFLGPGIHSYTFNTSNLKPGMNMIEVFSSTERIPGKLLVLQEKQ